MSTETAVQAPDEVHSSVLGHHFDDLEQQRSACRLGMWFFLVTEILFFGGVFMAYTAYRLWYGAAFEAGSSKLNVLIAGINSGLLLTSSLTITMAIAAARKGLQKRLVFMLGMTCFLGILFLGFKSIEYYNDFKENLIPWANFDGNHFLEQGVGIPQVKLFFMFYYSMTGIHVIHLIVGIGLVGWLWWEALQGQIYPDRYVKVEVISLYWHFVDFAWLFLMPLLYLAGPHSLEHVHLFAETY